MKKALLTFGQFQHFIDSGDLISNWFKRKKNIYFIEAKMHM